MVERTHGPTGINVRPVVTPEDIVEAKARFKDDRIASLNILYYNSLCRALIDTKVWNLTRLNTPLRIVEVGCGYAEVIPAILSFFGGLPLGEIGTEVSYVGVDQNASLNKGEDRDSRLLRIFNNADDVEKMAQVAKFVTGDAQNLSALGINEADIVIARTPQVQKLKGQPSLDGYSQDFVANDVFRRIFSTAFRTITDDGLVIGSTQFGVERKMLSQMLDGGQRRNIVEGTTSDREEQNRLHHLLLDVDDFMVVAGKRPRTQELINLSRGVIKPHGEI